MTMSDRDRKLLLIVLPIVVVLVYWFLLLSPKREEAANLGEQVTAAEAARDQAVAAADQSARAKKTFERDYTEIVRLGKAIPPTVDMASLLVQLDSAANGTGIEFDKILAGARVSTAGESAAGGQDAAGAQPQSGAGKAAASAEDAQAKTEGAAQKSDSASNAQPAASGGAPAAAPPGLDMVPLQLTFTGTFFDLADFMHRLKRYVRVRGEGVSVKGRLMRIESLKLTPKEGAKLSAELSASVYLSPKTEGATAGATPQGPAPAQTTPASGAPPAPAPNTAGVAR